MRPKVVGIGGGTGSGKSTVVRLLQDQIGAACIVDLDSYYGDRSDVEPAARSSLNYDEPAAVDLTLLLEHVRSLLEGKAIPKPEYSFITHTRMRSHLFQPAPVILVEGLFALWWEELRELFDLKVFVDAPADIRLARRIRRDVVERGRKLEDVLVQYFATIRLMHGRYVEPTRWHADVVVSNTDSMDVGLEAARQIEHALAICSSVAVSEEKVETMRLASYVTKPPWSNAGGV